MMMVMIHTEPRSAHGTHPHSKHTHENEKPKHQKNLLTDTYSTSWKYRVQRNEQVNGRAHAHNCFGGGWMDSSRVGSSALCRDYGDGVPHLSTSI